jgi:hypothetical protein
MKDLWLTYDLPEGMNFMTILEGCEVDEDEDDNTIIKGGIEVPVTLDELKTIAKIFNDAITNIERSK